MGITEKQYKKNIAKSKKNMFKHMIEDCDSTINYRYENGQKMEGWILVGGIPSDVVKKVCDHYKEKGYSVENDSHIVVITHPLSVSQ